MSETPPDPFVPPAVTPADSESNPADEPSVLARLDGFQPRRVRPMLHNWADRRGGELPESVVVVHSGRRGKELVVTVRSEAGPKHGSYVKIAVEGGWGEESEEEEQATKVFDRASMLPPHQSYFSTAPRSLTAAQQSEPEQGAPRSAQDTQRCAPQAAAKPSEASSAGLWLTGLILLLSTISLSLGLPVEPKHHAAVTPMNLPEPRGATTPSLPTESTRTRPLSPAPTRAPALKRAVLPLAAAARQPSARIEVNGLYLSVSAEPWVRVVVDGRRVSNTPVKRMVLRPGNHQVVLVNDDLNLRTKTTIQSAVGSREVQDLTL